MGNDTKLTLHIAPNAPRNEVLGFTEGILRLRIAAPPLQGKANRELLAYLSRLLSVRPDCLRLTRGHTSRYKTVVIEGLSRDEVLKRLAPEA